MDGMDSTKPTGAAVNFPPPLLFLMLIGVGFSLETFLYATAGLLEGRLLGLGWAFIALAMVVFKLAIQHFSDTEQDVRPWAESPELIVDGIYRYTRNPMYVGMGLLQTGIGLTTLNLWTIGLVPVGLALVYVIAIRPEEEYLTGKFGQPYVDYTKRVSRWI